MDLGLLILALLLIAGGLAVGGVYLLIGLAWAMIAGAIALVILAAVLTIGVRTNG